MKGHPAVPRSLSLVVMRGLERDRDERWISARAMEDAIQRHLSGSAPVVCPHTAYSRTISAVGRQLDAYPRVVILSTLTLLALALVGAYQTVMAALRLWSPD